jgi:hypothetical protein
MKRTNKLKTRLLIFASLAISVTLFSQEEESKPFRAGADFVSSYIWRGSKYGTGPAVQPVIEYSRGIFTAGAWGSFDFNGYQEADLYLKFSLPEGFSLGITDYYLSDLDYFDYSIETGSHAFEANLGFSKGDFNLGFNYIFNEAGGVGSLGNDIYTEAGYSLKYFGLFLGAGNGWYTYDPETGNDKFKVCNMGLKVSKDIKVTETFKIPVSGQLIFNPDKEQLFIVVGFTL